MHKHLKFCSVSLLLAASACASSQAEQVKDARMGQTEANAEVDQNSVDQAGKAHQESVDNAHDARGERIADANRPGENSTDELNEVARDRAKYQSDAQTRVSKLGVRIDEATKKVGVLGDRAPAKLHDELKTASTEYSLLKQDVNKLDNTKTTDWESKTSQIDQRISQLGERLDNLKESIDDIDV
jgi:endonuclease/exonuclease/phosphatase (EEP) superfamily protein YafD